MSLDQFLSLFFQTEEIQAVIEKQPHAAATLENTKNCIS